MARGFTVQIKMQKEINKLLILLRSYIDLHKAVINNAFLLSKEYDDNLLKKLDESLKELEK